MLDSIATYIVNEWRMIAEAPVTIFMIVGVIALLIWWALSWSYSGRLANKDEQISLQDRQLADYKQKLDGASPDEAKAEIERLKQEVARLISFAPRHLTEEQRRIIAREAEIDAPQKPALAIGHAMGCDDCSRYASDLARTFESAGWSVGKFLQSPEMGKRSLGLAVRIYDPDALTDQDKVLMQALDSADIPMIRGLGHPRSASLLVSEPDD